MPDAREVTYRSACGPSGAHRLPYPLQAFDKPYTHNSGRGVARGLTRTRQFAFRGETTVETTDPHRFIKSTEKLVTPKAVGKL